jgi:hypothetical protein
MRMIIWYCDEENSKFKSKNSKGVILGKWLPATSRNTKKGIQGIQSFPGSIPIIPV